MKRLVLAILLAVTPARADSIWEKAKTAPVSKDLQKLGFINTDAIHRDVAARLHSVRTEKVNNPLGGAQLISTLDHARTILLLADAAHSSDPRLRYDLGTVLAKLRKCADATVALENALAFAKDHPFAQDGAFELAICYSVLGKHADEERAYLIALEISDRPTHKAVIYSNLAESRMAQGKLDEGIDAVEEAIAIEPDFASPRYNLAILKDRAGEPFGALDAAKHAVELDPEGDYLDGEGVFFEPAYEKYWYYALRDLALADRTTGDERINHLLAALVAYRKWLDAAELTDRYRPRCVEAIARLEKILKLKPPKP
jgi:tetratricopeptide (TPR) repeat protein